jgi:HAMP domain-containing protein
MFKDICARAIIPVAVAVTGFVVVCCLLLYAAVKTDMINGTVRHSSALADTIIQSTRYAMLRSDRETIRNIISNIGDQKGVEHVRIFNKKGLVMFSQDPGEVDHLVDKKAAGCVGCHAGPVPKATLEQMQKARTFVNKRHVKVLAITAPIYNEPACYTAACHFHSADSKLLGTLDIGLDRAPLEKALSVLGGRMLGFSLMVLILTVGGVAALLRKNVFVPIRTLTDFTDRVANGNLSDDIPEIGGELERVGHNVRNVVLQYRQAVARLNSMEEAAGKAGSRTHPSIPSDRGAGQADSCQPEQEMTHGESTQAPAQGREAEAGSPLPGNPEEDP